MNWKTSKTNKKKAIALSPNWKLHLVFIVTHFQWIYEPIYSNCEKIEKDYYDFRSLQQQLSLILRSSVQISNQLEMIHLFDFLIFMGIWIVYEYRIE